MSDVSVSQTPLFDADGKLRMGRFMVATIASAIAIGALTTWAVHAAAPEGGWSVAIGIGAMIGFWMCPLAGAVFGNGLHEIAKDREKARTNSAPIALGGPDGSHEDIDATQDTDTAHDADRGVTVGV